MEQLKRPEQGDQIAVVNTNLGSFQIRFFPEQAPKAVENFITHAKNGYYNGVVFHRVLKDFMIQGGDPTGTGCGGESIWGEPFGDECTPALRHFYGALSMANGDRTRTEVSSLLFKKRLALHRKSLILNAAGFSWMNRPNSNIMRMAVLRG